MAGRFVDHYNNACQLLIKMLVCQLQ